MYKPLISYCFMTCEVFPNKSCEKNGNLRISRCYDITYEKWSRPPQILVYLEYAQ